MSKPTLILLHGFRGTHHGLQKIVDHLDGFHLVVPDLPGFGEGPQLDSYDIESYVRWVHDFMSQYDTPYLLGHSFGSILASAYVSTYPHAVKKLILVNPIGAPALEGPRGALTKLAVFYYFVGKKLPARLAKPWLSTNLSTDVMSHTMTKSKDKALRAFVFDQHRKHFSRFHSADSVHQGFVTSVSCSVRDYAKNISVPTLLVAGEKDDITPIEKQQELLTLFPDASLVVIKGVGHLTHYETPAEVADAVQAFIKSE